MEWLFGGIALLFGIIGYLLSLKDKRQGEKNMELIFNTLINPLVFAYILYIGFGYYAGVRPAWKRMLIGHKLLNAPALLMLGAMDVLFDTTIGSLLFWEMPWQHSAGYYQPMNATVIQKLFSGRVWTFSQRLDEHVFDHNWRGVVAKAFATLLNTIYPEHIRGR